MKNKLIVTLALGLVIGTMGVTAFVNEKDQNISDVDLNSAVQNKSTFKLLDQQNNQYNENTSKQNNRPQYMNQGNCCYYN